ncbi:MAG: flavodoxin family protein [Halanaerobiales bacterium]
MKILIMSASPNQDGLTANCVKQVKSAANELSQEIIHIDLNKLDIKKCRACDNGWGICRTKHECIIEDDFNESLEFIKKADAFVIITPVYWWEMSESLKTYLDRLRRTQASKRWDNKTSFFINKPVIAVAAAGGSGNGTIPCLASMERFIEHVGGDKFDFISVTQKNKKYKLEAIRKAAITLVSEYI